MRGIRNSELIANGRLATSPLSPLSPLPDSRTGGFGNPPLPTPDSL
ncbi:hypothetical protein H6G17_00610 [Chroococcidiopsis sp. FACHB-1243]|nr:hypothetical protein [Chroococcidiopsis sp. [FACHB-1243]]MBD2304022.1 hypothetical protein [Chroococcidiopsis sp. [FACHB-1243]]